MAFKLAKASGVRVPDLVDDIPVDGSTITIDNIVNGTPVRIVAGELALGAAGSAVAGILVNEAGDARYAAPSGQTYTSTFIGTDKATFLPVTGTLLIQADVSGTLAEFVPGKSFDIELTGNTVVGAASPVTSDFRVVRLVKNEAGTVVAVQGFFTSTGYFTA